MPIKSLSEETDVKSQNTKNYQKIKALQQKRALNYECAAPELYRVMYCPVHKYGWNCVSRSPSIAVRTNYTADELKELYRRHFLD